jgi:hypothetical protein
MIELPSFAIIPLKTALVEWRGSGTSRDDIEIIVTPINIDINAIAKTILLIGYHSSLVPSFDAPILMSYKYVF